MRYVDKKEGNIFFIPLFLPSGIRENVKSYTAFRFDVEETYAFGRLIERSDASGDLVEIFQYIGAIPDNQDVILRSGRAAEPLHVTMAFDRSRWRFIFESVCYDKNADSKFPEISFLLGTEDSFVLWKGRSKQAISNSEASRYSFWTVFPPTKVEEALRTNSLHRLK